MKVVLYDLDITPRRRPFPNLALMKLSTYHKKRGDTVMMGFPLIQADKSYASCVFSWNAHHLDGLNAEAGGSALDINKVLPDEIEHIMPDYTLYPHSDFSMGFTSRGCPRKCPWCLVPNKEGNIKAWADPREFYNPAYRRMLILDNNLFASPNWRETLATLSVLSVLVDFNQGLDIRLLNDDNLVLLRQVHTEKLRFAFDSLDIEREVRAGIEKLLKVGYKKSHISFYVLVGFPNDDTAIERMKILQGYGVGVFPMIYKDHTGKEPKLNLKWDETLDFRGSRGNLRKFLRVVGRI